MKTMIVDFNKPKKPKTVWHFHEHLIEPLGLERIEDHALYPGYKYAKNLDALWDLLYLSSQEEIKFIIRNIDNLSKELDDEVAIFKEVMDRLERKDKNVQVVYEQD